jgi:uncharacterized membrane protein YbhN (UPF0104 family)
MKSKLRTVLTFVFGWPLSFLAVFFLGKTMFAKTAMLGTSLKSFNPLLLFLGILCFLVYFFLRAYLWQKIIAEKGHQLPLKDAVFLWEYAEIKRFLPGKIWSFLARIMLFSQKGVDRNTIISSMAIEIVFFVIGGLLVSLFCLFYIFTTLLAHIPFSNAIAFAIFFTVLLLAFLCIGSKYLLSKVTNKYLLLIKHALPNFYPHTTLAFLLPLTYC